MEMLTRMVEVAKLPIEEQFQPIKATIAEFSAQQDAQMSLADVNAKTCLSNLFSFRNKLLREHSRSRSVAVALAAECYRRTHDGRWPDKLADLTPEFIPEVPLDPYTAQPLRYRILDDNIVIYSIGADLVDDGGRIDDPDPWL